MKHDVDGWLLLHRVSSRFNQLVILFDGISSQKHIPEVLELQFRGQKSIPGVCGKQFQVAKPIPRIVECWRKMRNHSAEMKSLIANCAAYFFSEKSNFQTEIRLRKFVEWFRILRRLSHRGTPVAICASCPTVEHQSHFAPHIPRWDTVRKMRHVFLNLEVFLIVM